jgi:hypothetical protein
MVIDGRHSPLKFCAKDAQNLYKGTRMITQTLGEVHQKSYFSYKLRGPGLNTQIAIAADMYVEWVGKTSMPASLFPDVTQMKHEIIMCGFEVDDRDVIAFDGAYQDMPLPEDQVVLPHRMPDSAQSDENDEFTNFRGDVERSFGAAVTKFPWLVRKYAHGEAEFNEDFKHACAILNCELLAKQKYLLDPDSEENLRNHPFFSSRIDIFEEVVVEELPEPTESLWGNKWAYGSDEAISSDTIEETGGPDQSSFDLADDTLGIPADSPDSPLLSQDDELMPFPDQRTQSHQVSPQPSPLRNA